VRTLQRTRPYWPKRLAVTLMAFAAVLGVSVTVTPAADATVYSTCTISRCSAARSADATWEDKNYPGTRGWYDWPNGQCNYAGGTFRNDEGQLPSGHSFREFDVYPRTCGAARDAYRIVVDLNTGVVWFSPNHYTDFYRL
jgi:ribonuclease T1